MMNSAPKIISTLFLILLVSACNNKPKPAVQEDSPKAIVTDSIPKNEDSIEGFYETQPEPDNTDECTISVEIRKGKSGYIYFLKTKLRKLKGIASFTKNESGEKYITLEGIKWDEFEGDISREEESDSTETDHKELEIPVGIDASYVKDTMTIQNYGNSMNSYTKISECARKYIQLIRK
jgi:hypothetical protein